ncbi:MAG: L-threonine ammonia-lyase [Myxococcota bacterium]|nr:L-threonine ammonia-lyase [Myxococcota bacterium]
MSTGIQVTIHDIEQARERIKDAIFVTPCAFSQSLSNLTGCKVYCKLENLQMTGSFKERGALNKLLRLTQEEKAAGVIASSAGNHAQGLAYHATRLGIAATIVMPEATPIVKVTATRGYGGNVVLKGNSYDEAFAHACLLQKEHGYTFVHPFNDPLIVAGQGTMGLELLEQNPYLDSVVVPIGGGGMISGVAIALKETNPKIRIIGVETESVPSMKEAMKKGEPVEVPAARSIADGIAVRRAGDVTLPIVRKYVDDIVTVSEEETANAVMVLLEREKTLVEGAGAVPLAALLNNKVNLKGRKVALVLSGGNIDVNVLSRIIERGLVKDGRLAKLSVTISDTPGSLASLTAVIGTLRANIMEIYHNRAFSEANLGETIVDLTIETRGHEHVSEIITALEGRGLKVTIETPHPRPLHHTPHHPS